MLCAYLKSRGEKKKKKKRKKNIRRVYVSAGLLQMSLLQLKTGGGTVELVKKFATRSNSYLLYDHFFPQLSPLPLSLHARSTSFSPSFFALPHFVVKSSCNNNRKVQRRTCSTRPASCQLINGLQRYIDVGKSNIYIYILRRSSNPSGICAISYIHFDE